MGWKNDVLEATVPFAIEPNVKNAQKAKYKAKDVVFLADIGASYGAKTLTEVKPLIKTQLTGQNVGLIAVTPQLAGKADKVASKVMDMEKAMGDNLKEIVFNGNSYDTDAFIIQATTKDNQVNTELLDKNLKTKPDTRPATVVLPMQIKVNITGCAWKSVAVKGSPPSTAALINTTSPLVKPTIAPPKAPSKIPANAIGIKLKLRVTPSIGIALAKSCKTITNAIKMPRIATFFAEKNLLFIITSNQISFRISVAKKYYSPY